MTRAVSAKFCVDIKLPSIIVLYAAVKSIKHAIIIVKLIIANSITNKWMIYYASNFPNAFTI